MTKEQKKLDSVPPPRVGCRIPCDFFRSKGVGFSDFDCHTGSAHQAMYNAGISDWNLLYYSSMLSRESKETTRPMNIPRGSVMETIIAQIDLDKKQGHTSGICGIKWGRIMDRETGQPAGGIVVERKLFNTTSEADMAEELTKCLGEVYQNGFFEKYDITTTDMITQAVTTEEGKRYATGICCLCFYNFIYPTA